MKHKLLGLIIWLPLATMSQTDETETRFVVCEAEGEQAISSMTTQTAAVKDEATMTTDFWSYIIGGTTAVTPVSQNTDERVLTINEGKLTLPAEAHDICVYSINGSVIFTGNTSNVMLQKGFYLIQTGTQIQKVVVR